MIADRHASAAVQPVVVPRPAVLFAAISLWLSLEFIILGPYSVVPIFDYADSWVAIQFVLKANLFSHGMTNWFPAMSAGVDRLAQDHIYGYVPNLLALVLPIWLSNFLHIFFQYFLGMFFVHRLCREHLQIGDLASVLAGVVFAVFCEFNPMLLGVYLFPATLYGFDRIWRCQGQIRSFALTIGLALATVLCSLVVYLPYTLPWLALWFLLVRGNRTPKFLAMYVVYCGVIVLCKVPSLAAFLLNAAQSQRDFIIPGHKAMDRAFYVAFWAQTLTWLFRSVVVFALLVLGAGLSRFRDGMFNLFLTCLFVTTIGASLLNLVTIALHVPLAGYQMARFFLISPLFYAIGLAYAFRHLPERMITLPLFRARPVNVRTAAYAIAFAALFGNSVMVKVANAKEWLRNGSYAANFDSEQMKQLAAGRTADPFRVATSASLILPMYALAYRLEASDGYTNLYPMRYKQFWSRLIEPLRSRNADVDRYFTNFGKRVYLFPPAEPPPASIKLSDYYNLNLLSLVNTKYLISRSALLDDHLLLVQKPAQEFYRLSRREQVRARLTENLSGNNTLFVYENKSVLPRFFVARTIASFDTDDDLLSELSRADATSLGETMFVNKSFVANVDVGSLACNGGHVHLVRYSPDIIRLRVRADGTCFLVASNAYSPYWKVLIDGEAAPLIPADHAFWGVLLRPGDHAVTFDYAPPYKLLASADVN